MTAALSTFYPRPSTSATPQERERQISRLIAKIPTLAAFAYRHSMGLPYVYPDNELSYAGNFLQMMFKTSELKYKVHPALERALDVLFILHADHEQNCSTSAMRAIGSSEVDPYSPRPPAPSARSTARSTAAPTRPCCGCCRRSAPRTRSRAFVKEVKESGGDVRLMGFGHRVYKNYDPRAKIIKKMADQVFEVTGRNPLLDIALELERIALEDEYFVKRKLYPNVDFYSGLIYQAMKFPIEHVPRAVRDPAHVRLARAVAGDARGQGPEDRPPAPDLPGVAERDYVPLHRRA